MTVCAVYGDLRHLCCICGFGTNVFPPLSNAMCRVLLNTDAELRAWMDNFLSQNWQYLPIRQLKSS